MDLSEGEDARSVGGSSRESNDSICFCCRGGGEVVCCEGCTNSFHIDCLDTARRPQLTDDDWYCPECVARAERKGEGGLPPSTYFSLLPASCASNFHPSSPLNAKDENEAPTLSPLRVAKRRSLRASASSSPLVSSAAPDEPPSRGLAKEKRENEEKGEGEAEGREGAERRGERREEKDEEKTAVDSGESGQATREDLASEAPNSAASPSKTEPPRRASSSETPSSVASPAGAAPRRTQEDEKEEKNREGRRGAGAPPSTGEKEDDREERADRREGSAGADGDAQRGRAFSLASPLPTAASSRELDPPPPSHPAAPSSSLSSLASCRAGGRWGASSSGPGSGSSGKKRRRRGDETRINVGPDYQVPRLPDFYLSRTDELASAEEARCALFPFAPSLSARASLFVSSAYPGSSSFASVPSASSFFAFQDSYSRAAAALGRKTPSHLACAAARPFAPSAHLDVSRVRCSQAAGEEKKRSRPGVVAASPSGVYFSPPVFQSLDGASLGTHPPGGLLFAGVLAVGEDSRHSALEPRLVYSPRCLEEKRQQCLATGRMQHCIRTQGELADFVETCSRCWHARPGWQPFSAEFAYQLLHRAGYDPQRALRMLDDPGFCFNDICDPPLRKYDNKWKRRDKRGTFPNSPYPPPLVIQAFLQEKTRGCRPASLSHAASTYMSR
uniref:PHD-finger domain-containing protein, putative n=1 Tax=Neospora caninum (strain Liverpool) TaxID=572307 RepID=A0A0F7UE62_NEOCL|nr:TPA: PHD-finger domain-containing protein, putative [Neospora caninum Liverpool]